MIIPDTNIWIGHLRARDERLSDLMARKQVRLHPFVLGEISLGLSGSARRILDTLSELRPASVATPGEVGQLIERRRLYGSGIGYVDAHLLASVRLTPGGRLWTRDKRLHAQADRLGVAYAP